MLKLGHFLIGDSFKSKPVIFNELTTTSTLLQVFWNCWLRYKAVQNGRKQKERKKNQVWVFHQNGFIGQLVSLANWFRWPIGDSQWQYAKCSMEANRTGKSSKLVFLERFVSNFSKRKTTSTIRRQQKQNWICQV